MIRGAEIGRLRHLWKGGVTGRDFVRLNSPRVVIREFRGAAPAVNYERRWRGAENAGKERQYG